MPPQVSILITTRNRREELLQAVASAVAQGETTSIEIVVIDDGSTDGTSESISAAFPRVSLHRVEQSRGYIVQRNRGVRLAQAPIVVSIDDDARFSAPTVVADLLQEFASPVVGAVAIPYVDMGTDAARVRQRAPAAAPAYACASFVGTAHAVRRDVFIRLGGYRESLFHQGEESDYCLRMLAGGYVVRLGRSGVIHHFESPRRDLRRMDTYGRRNNVLFGWHNVPWPALPFYWIATTWHGLRHGWAVGRLGRMAAGLACGYAAIWQERHQRSPVSLSVFRLYRQLVRRGAVPFPEIEGRLPPRPFG